ncbi:MAG: peptidase inhibitor family I36 protein [Acidimicrobiia bacterium]|nr:peptidase inhibitor family I36 protein [Acidimicrobiia bacterium]
MSRRVTVLVLLILALLPLAAHAHDYSTSSPNPTNCNDQRFCVYVYDNYGTGDLGGVLSYSSVEVDLWAEPWRDSDNSAFNDWNANAVRAYEGSNQTGGWYCLSANGGNQNLPFHHDNQGDSHIVLTNC